MSPSKRLRSKKKYFSVTEANAMLPLLRAILQDVTVLAHSLRERQDRISTWKWHSSFPGQWYSAQRFSWPIRLSRQRDDWS
jgi:hypothetical protein